MTMSKLSVFSLAGASIVFCQICCEVVKQLTNYSIQYFNNGVYPVPSTAMVATLELFKLLFTIFMLKGDLPLNSFKTSLGFLFPSVLYAANNNIYYFALTLVSPPILLILCSMRTVLTALTYKFILGRRITLVQGLGVAMIVASVVVTKLEDVISSSNSSNSIPTEAVLLALVTSSISVCAAIYTELLFKNKNFLNFSQQQFWLYTYGFGVSSFTHLVYNPGFGLRSYYSSIIDMSNSIFYLYFSALAFSAFGGIAVAHILKHLDNVAKDYSGSVANIFTVVFSSILFPEKFEITPFVIGSLILLIVGIFIYENEKRKSH